METFFSPQSVNQSIKVTIFFIIIFFNQKILLFFPQNCKKKRKKKKKIYKIQSQNCEITQNKLDIKSQF